MTMAHISRSFAVSLSICHPDIDPAEVTKAIGLVPTKVSRCGEPRKTPKGERLEGTYPFSFWSHSFDVSGAVELGQILEELTVRFRGYEQFFQRMVRENGSVELFCGVFVDGNWDEVLSHRLMRLLADLHIDLRLDVYPKSDGNDAGRQDGRDGPCLTN
jgi:hypothetical protein